MPAGLYSVHRAHSKLKARIENIAIHHRVATEWKVIYYFERSIWTLREDRTLYLAAWSRSKIIKLKWSDGSVWSRTGTLIWLSIKVL